MHVHFDQMKEKIAGLVNEKFDRPKSKVDENYENKDDQINKKAVSYTHLDVYKRQCQCHPILFLFVCTNVSCIPRGMHENCI